MSVFLDMFENYIKGLLIGYTGELGEGMRYAVLGGGKRIRPCFAYMAFMEASQGIIDSGVPSDDIVDSYGNLNEELVDSLIYASSALELIHCYSLVHDDMPEMDNDDMRRGKPSVHKKFGHAMALLIGDALQTLAMSQIKGDDVLRLVTKSAMDMVAGQAAELAGCHTESEFLEMYKKKTSALIKCAFALGTLIGAPDMPDPDMLFGTYAECLGLMFQLSDDLLESEDKDKFSIVGVIGREKTKALVEEYLKKAIYCTEDMSLKDELVNLAEVIAHRKK